MKRFYSPRIDLLEDRCVPAVDAIVAATGALDADVSTDPSAGGVVETVDPGLFVIDVYLNDPSTLPSEPVKPVDFDNTAPIPDEYWTEPSEPAQPVDDPFWY